LQLFKLQLAEYDLMTEYKWQFNYYQYKLSNNFSIPFKNIFSVAGSK
jgi:hypothetical protein